MIRKPRPAPIHEKNKDLYRLHFSFDGRQHKKFYIPNQREAFLLQEEINRKVRLIKAGILQVPPGVSISDFVFLNLQKPNEEGSQIAPLLSLSEIVNEYRRLSVPPIKAKTTCLTEQIHLRHLERFIADRNYGDLPLKRITVGFFDNYKNFRYAEGMRTDTVNKELGTLQTVLQMAVDHGYLGENVLKLVKRDRSQVPCDRFRTLDETRKLLQSGNYSAKEKQEIMRFQYLTMPEIEDLIRLAAGHWIQPILIAFAYTGMRRGEMLRLEWADVDLEARCLYARSKKQSRQQLEVTRRIPIHARLLPVLIEQQKLTGNGRWVFLDSAGKQLTTDKLSWHFHHLVLGTDFEGLGYHVFRHSICSNLAAKGIEQHYIDGLLGHQTEAMRQRYKHLFPKYLEEALSRLETL